MRTSELHDELVEAILQVGAVRPGPLFPPGYSGDNADAIFVDERALVEVKSICEDHSAVVELEDRLAPAFQRWAQETGAVVFGTVAIKWDDYPDWLKHEIEDKMAPSVNRQMRKANKQLRQTKAAINWGAGYGIVVFVVPNGFNADPWVIGRIAWNQLMRRQGHLPEIDAVIMVTVEVEDQPPSERAPIFAPCSRHNEGIPHDLSARIRDAWFQQLSRKEGRPVYAFGATTEDFFKVPRPPIRLRFEL